MEWHQIEALIGKIGLGIGTIFGAWKVHSKWIRPLLGWCKSQFSLVRKTNQIDLRLEILETELATFIKLSGTAIFKAEPDTGYITSVNIVWAELFGMPEDEAKGNNWHKAIKDKQSFKKAWDSNLKSHTLFNEDLIVIHQDTKKEQPVNCKAVIQNNKKGKAISIIGLLTLKT